jgi:hypothetical protein
VEGNGGGNGGGILNGGAGTLTLINSTVSANESEDGFGGGIEISLQAQDVLIRILCHGEVIGSAQPNWSPVGRPGCGTHCADLGHSSGRDHGDGRHIRAESTSYPDPVIRHASRTMRQPSQSP